MSVEQKPSRKYKILIRFAVVENRTSLTLRSPHIYVEGRLLRLAEDGLGPMTFTCRIRNFMSSIHQMT
jgi:hypothetical protein